MNWTIRWSMNADVDRRLLFAVVALGAGAICGGSYWLKEGEIAIRQNNSHGEVAGLIAGDHVLFYPVCAAWIGLGVAMATLSIAALLCGQVWLDVLAFWSCAAILPLGFLTILTAILVKPG